MERTWSLKAFSQKSGVSIKALRTYRRIQLLIPSHRAGLSGRRKYSEAELLKLKKIVVLKMFDYSIETIQGLLFSEWRIEKDFKNNGKLKRRTARHLLTVRTILSEIVVMSTDSQSKAIWQSVYRAVSNHYKIEFSNSRSEAFYL